MSTKRKQLPTWYKLYLNKRIKRLENALINLDHADNMISRGYLMSAACFIKLAKYTLNKEASHANNL